jgi:hypothetical protein
MKTFIRAAALTITLAAATGTAHAGEQGRMADCVWASTPKAVRDAMAAAAPDPEAMIDRVGAEQGLRLAQTCHVPQTKDGIRLIQHSLSAHALELWSSDQLQRRFGVTPAKQAEAWSRLSPRAKREYATVFDEDGSQSNQSIDELHALAVDLKMGDGPAADELVLFDYVAARAVLARLQES